MKIVRNGDTTIFLENGATSTTENGRLNVITLADGKLIHAYHGDSKIAKDEIKKLVEAFAAGKTTELNIQGDWNIDWASKSNQDWLKKLLTEQNLYINSLSFPMDPNNPGEIWVREKKRLDGQNNAQWSKSGVTDVGVKDAAFVIRKIIDSTPDKIAAKEKESNAQFAAATAAQAAFKAKLEALTNELRMATAKEKPQIAQAIEALQFGGENGLKLDHPVVSSNGVITVNLLSTQYTGLNPLEHKPKSDTEADIELARAASEHTESLSNRFAAADYRKAREIFRALFAEELGTEANSDWRYNQDVMEALVKDGAIKTEHEKTAFDFSSVNSKFDKEHQAIFKHLMEKLKEDPAQKAIAENLIKNYINTMYSLPEFKDWFDSWPEEAKKTMCPSGVFNDAEIDAYAKRQIDALLADSAGTIKLIISGRSDKIQSLRNMGILKEGILAKDARNPHEFEGMCLTPGSLVCGGFRPLPGKTQHENDCLQIKEVHEQLKSHEGEIHCIALQEYSSPELHSPVVEYYFEQIMEDPNKLESAPEAIIKAYEEKTLEETKRIISEFDGSNPKELYKLMQQCAEKRLPAASETLALKLLENKKLNKAFFVEYLLHNAKGPLPAKLAHEFLLENVFTDDKLKIEFTTVLKALKMEKDIVQGACNFYKHHEDQEPLKTISTSIEKLSGEIKKLKEKIKDKPEKEVEKDSKKLKGMKKTLDALKAEQTAMPEVIKRLQALRGPVSKAAASVSVANNNMSKGKRAEPSRLVVNQKDNEFLKVSALVSMFDKEGETPKRPGKK